MTPYFPATAKMLYQSTMYFYPPSDSKVIRKSLFSDWLTEPRRIKL